MHGVRYCLLAEDLLLAEFMAERPLSKQHLVEDNANGPDIDLRKEQIKTNRLARETAMMG